MSNDHSPYTCFCLHGAFRQLLTGQLGAFAQFWQTRLSHYQHEVQRRIHERRGGLLTPPIYEIVKEALKELDAHGPLFAALHRDSTIVSLKQAYETGCACSLSIVDMSIDDMARCAGVAPSARAIPARARTSAR
jgi:hypothetical protein